MSAPAAEIPKPAAASDLLTVAFGTVVVMWAVGYFCRMIPGVPAWLLLSLLVLVQVAGGAVLAKSTLRGPAAAAGCGAIIGLVNLLILGAVLAEHGASIVRIAVGVVGFIAASAALCALGWLIGCGGRAAPLRPAEVNWPGRFAVVTVGATIVLIVAGGLVTGWRAGLAVADWPNTEGALMFLYPLSKMTGGVYYEHAHRLYGALVGLTTVVFAIHLWFQPRGEPGRCIQCGYDLQDNVSGVCPECGGPARTVAAAGLPPMPRWVQWLALAAVVLVIAQGIMGGLRVTGRLTLEQDPEQLQPNTFLAITHGVTAQVFLGLVTAIAVFCSTTWRRRPDVRPVIGAGVDHALSSAVLITLFLQLILGATFRHFSRDPAYADGAMHALYAHMGFAAVVLACIVVAGLRATTLYRDIAPVHRSGRALLHTVGLQIALGILAFIAVISGDGGLTIPWWEVAFTTAHQATGAVLLACAVAYWLWTKRLLRPANPEVVQAAVA